MNLTMVIEGLGFLVAIGGVLLLLSSRERRRQGNFGPYLLALFCIAACLHALDFLEWQGRDFADRMGDMMRIVIPVLWLGLAFEAYRAAQAEESSERLEQFRLILEQTHLPTVLMDEKGLIVDCSDSFLFQSACLRQEIIGRRPRALDNLPTEVLQEAFERGMASEGAICSRQSRVVSWGGEDLQVSWFAQRWLDPANGKPGGVSVVLDLSQTQATSDREEMEMAEASTVEVPIPQLSQSRDDRDANSALAHDLGNFLQIITGQAELLAFDLDRQLRQRAMSISQAGKTAFEMVRALSRPDRNHQQKRVMIDLRELLENTVTLTQPTLPPNIRLLFEAGETEAPVLGDRVRLQRVVVNLILNARDAMPQGGTILIRLAIRDCEAQVQIVDEGQGIPEAIQERIFERYFTTKPTGKGSGIGLTLAREILQEHDGDIKLVKSDARGTEFRLMLPLYVEHEVEI